MRVAFNRFVERHEVAWELGMAALAIAYVIVGFAGEDGTQSGATIRSVELALTIVFVLEFTVRFAASFDRGGYLRGHWIDLVALVPTVRQFRLLRLLRLLRLVRTFAGIYRALLHVERILGNRQIATIAVIWLAILVLTSFGMYTAVRRLRLFPALFGPMKIVTDRSAIGTTSPPLNVTDSSPHRNTVCSAVNCTLRWRRS